MTTLIALLTIAAGMLMPTQAGINSTFRDYAGHPLFAGVLNFSVGLVVLLGVVTASRIPWPNATAVAAAPWWSWAGGFCGASLVMVSIVAAPRLGAALMVVCLITGQLFAGLLLDHFGWVGYPVRPMTLSRVVGVLLLLAGVVVIHRGN